MNLFLEHYQLKLDFLLSQKFVNMFLCSCKRLFCKLNFNFFCILCAGMNSDMLDPFSPVILLLEMATSRLFSRFDCQCPFLFIFAILQVAAVFTG